MAAGACRERSPSPGTSQQARLEKPWHPEVTTAVWHGLSRKSPPAAPSLPAEGNLARRKSQNLLPFPRSGPMPAPASPTAPGSEAEARIPPPKRSWRAATEPHTKGKRRLKQTGTHRARTRTDTHAGCRGDGAGGEAVGGWLGGEEKFHAGLFKGVLFVQGCPNICGALAGPECVRELRQRS